jgi:hypothetical protein
MQVLRIAVLRRARLGGIPDRSVQSCTSTGIPRGGDEGKRDPASQLTRLSKCRFDLWQSGSFANFRFVARASTDERGIGDEILFSFTTSTSGIKRTR